MPEYSDIGGISQDYADNPYRLLEELDAVRNRLLEGDFNNLEDRSDIISTVSNIIS